MISFIEQQLIKILGIHKGHQEDYSQNSMNTILFQNIIVHFAFVLTSHCLVNPSDLTGGT
jgi:hypothetical protein